MKHQIVTEPADVRALVRFAAGLHRPSRGDKFFHAAIVAVCLGVAVSAVVEGLTSGSTSAEGVGTFLIVIGSCVAIAALMIDRATTSYYFSATVIERRSPLAFRNLSLDVDHIHEGYFHVDKGVSLELIDSAEKRLLVPLEGKLRSDLARLYPEIGTDPDFRAPVLPSRYRPLIWATLFVILVAIAVIVVVQTRRGDLAW